MGSACGGLYRKVSASSGRDDQFLCAGNSGELCCDESRRVLKCPMPTVPLYSFAAIICPIVKLFQRNSFGVECEADVCGDT